MDIKEEFEQDRKVDPEQLDVEAAQQADLFFKWAEREVEAKIDVDRAKYNLEITDAKLATRIREDPERYDVKKVTESSIAAAVQNHPRHAAAYETFLSAKATHLMLEKAVLAMEQKKRMIEVLVTLHGQEYFAGPSVPRDLGAAWKESQQRRSERVNNLMRERVVSRKSKGE